MKVFIAFILIIFASVDPLLAKTKTASAPATAAPSKEARAMSPVQRADAYFHQGYLYYLEGSYKLATPEFIKALKYDPNMVKARYWMAKTSYKLENYRSVINQCDSALKIEPKNKTIISLRERALAKLASEKIVKKVTPIKPAPAAVQTPATNEAGITTPEAKAIVITQEVNVPVVTIEAVKTPQAIEIKTAPRKVSQRLISMDLRNVDISTVLQIFSKETGISIVSGKDVYGKVTVILNNVTPEDALDAILKSNGYTYTRDGNMVQVFSSGEPARLEELPGGLFVRTFSINYIGPDELKETLTKLMPAGSNIFTTKGSKTVVVKGSANDIKRADILIRNLDIPPRQVMVEAKIVEVSLNEAQTMGMNHSWTDPNNATKVVQTTGLAGAPTAATATGLYYTVTDQNMTSLVETLATRTGFNILSSPKVMALNEQKAEIITGSRLGYKVKTTTTTGMVESVEFLDVGTKLVITPSIKSDGLIVMDIHPEISEGAIVGDLPQKQSTETTTQLIVKDGQTIIIGGLIRDSQKKEVKGVPLFMDIPLLGALLKRTEITTEKKEVIVLITPHIVNARLISEMEEKIKSIEKQRKDMSPVMNLDLLR